MKKIRYGCYFIVGLMTLIPNKNTPSIYHCYCESRITKGNYSNYV